MGISVLVTSLVGFLIYKKFGHPNQWRSTSQSEMGIVSMSGISNRSSYGSENQEGTNVRHSDTQHDKISIDSFDSSSTESTNHIGRNSSLTVE